MHKLFGGVGEVVNTLVCGTSIRGFDSHTPPHLLVYSNLLGYVIVGPSNSLELFGFLVYIKEE